MPLELKQHITSFVDQLPVKKKGKLAAAIYHHILNVQHQEDKGFEDPFTSTKSTIRIHKAPVENCHSCEA